MKIVAAEIIDVIEIQFSAKCIFRTLKIIVEI